MTNFKLIPVADIRQQYPSLVELEGFDLFEDWNDNDSFLVARGNVTHKGDFYLDVFEDKTRAWLSKLIGQKLPEDIRIQGILIDGDFDVNGCIINEEGDYGPFVFVAGNIRCQSLLLGGSYTVVNGNMDAEEVFYSFYNHGYFACHGTVTSPVFIADDHDTHFKSRQTALFYYNDRLGDYPEKNKCYDDEEMNEYVCSDSLRRHLDNPLTQTLEELQRDLADGEYVLLGQNSTCRDAAYWQRKVKNNYQDLKRVPPEYKTEQLCMDTLKITPFAIPFVPGQYITEELCRKLVDREGVVIPMIPSKYLSYELCLQAVKKGARIQQIPEEYLSDELIRTAFTYDTYEPDIYSVPPHMINESLLVHYVKSGRGLSIEPVCKHSNFDKVKILQQVIDEGIEHLDRIFANHCSVETYTHAAKRYQNKEYETQWQMYMDRYRSKLKRYGIEV